MEATAERTGSCSKQKGIIDCSGYDAISTRLFDHVDFHAATRPNVMALAEAETGAEVTWGELSTRSCAFAARLISAGVRYGDVVATLLPAIKEHIYLLVACWRIGAVAMPLDLRSRAADLRYAFNLVRPKAFFFAGKTPVVDFREFVSPLLEEYGGTGKGKCSLWVQFQKESDLVMKHPLVLGIADFAASVKWQYIYRKFTMQLWWSSWWVTGNEAAVIIFTTGSTGSPKPAVLSQKGVVAQAKLCREGFNFDENAKIVMNFPLSHVAAMSEYLGTWMFSGATLVLLSIFKAEETLRAIEKYKCTFMAQIPAMYQLLWRCPGWGKYDLSSLRLVGFGGQAVNSEFVTRLAKMAPTMFTGFGLTETSGICSCIKVPSSDALLLTERLGDSSSTTPIVIREDMKDGLAGAQLPNGKIGNITLKGAQVFMGYMGMPEETAKAISKDGVLYTGDVGMIDDEKGLLFVCRSKHVCKPKGYQVYPPEVEDFLITGLSGRASSVAVLGMAHSVYSEGLIAFVEPATTSNDPELHGESPQLTAADVMAVAAKLPSYKRPTHVEIIAPHSMPLNRVAKTDYIALKERATKVVSELRASGKWDAC